MLDRGFFSTILDSMTYPLTWLLLGVTFGIVGVSIWQFIVRNVSRQDALRAEVQDLAKKDAGIIQAQLIRSVSAVYALGAFIVTQATNSQAAQSPSAVFPGNSFDSIASILIETYGGITNLQLQPYGVVQRISPLAGNEGAIGHALFVDPNRVGGATATAESQKLAFVGPVPLVQGGVAVIARFPIFTTTAPRNIPLIRSWWPEWNHSCCVGMEMPANVSFPGPPEAGSNAPTYFWGFAGMLTLVDKLMENVQLSNYHGKYKYQLVDLTPADTIDPTGVFVHSPDAPPGTALKDAVVASIDYSEGGVVWELRMVPVDGWPTVSEDFAISLTILLIGATLSVVSRMVNISTKYSLNAAKAKLKEIRSTPGGQRISCAEVQYV